MNWTPELVAKAETYATNHGLRFSSAIDGGKVLFAQWHDVEPPSEQDILSASRLKAWPSVAEFNAEFTDAEKYAIIMCALPAVRVLDRELAMWRGEVIATDPRVKAGLDALQSAGIINETRKHEIITK